MCVWAATRCPYDGGPNGKVPIMKESVVCLSIDWAGGGVQQRASWRGKRLGRFVPPPVCSRREVVCVWSSCCCCVVLLWSLRSQKVICGCLFLALSSCLFLHRSPVPSLGPGPLSTHARVWIHDVQGGLTFSHSSRRQGLSALFLMFVRSWTLAF